MMTAQRATQHLPSRKLNQDTQRNNLQHAIEHAAHLLPAQGPIGVFIHHNTLHAFEELPFHEALRKGSALFGCQPYLPEQHYRDALEVGRIRFAELQTVLKEELGDAAETSILRLGSRLDLRLAMLQHPLHSGPTEELLWLVAETDALRCFRPEAAAYRSRVIAEMRRWVMRDPRGVAGTGLAGLLRRSGADTLENWSPRQWETFTLQALWRVCCDGAANVPPPRPMPPIERRHRDLLLHATGVDSDLLVNEVLIRFCAAFLDQGVSHWHLPQRDEGFLAAFRAVYGQAGGPPQPWLHGLREELHRLGHDQDAAPTSIAESLTLLDVDTAEWEAYLTSTLLALRGWGGMLRQTELRGDRVAQPSPPGTLDEFLAIRLLLDRLALAFVARQTLDFTGPLAELRSVCDRTIQPPAPPSVEQRAFQVFQLAQVLGWSPDLLFQLSPQDWSVLIGEMEAFDGIERRRIFHLAYERRFCNRSLDAIALHAGRPSQRPSSPRFQVMCCLDEREESFRRHLEELAPDAETLGAAGFFNVPMYYRGAADAHFVPLCPVVLVPRHWVKEEIAEELGETHRRRTRTRRSLGWATHRLHISSRSFALGALVSAVVGVLASFPLVARILFPRLAARIRRLFGSMVQPPPQSALQLERLESPAGAENGQVGFSLDEMAGFAERLLRDTGFTNGFARLVVILGHGSISLNNPHKSAYDCGACGGAMGGPNGRAIAQILNDARVRDRLAQRGVPLPADTVFVGGLHNTCNDVVTYFDLERIPASHRQEFASVQAVIEQACARNAHERCRRFMSAPLNMTPEEAHQHVETRSEDLAQVRPELGHATNALCIVGRRQRTRGLFLDRRAFLASYDPTQDDADYSSLTRLLQAAVPVCGGINLEYYFSRTDSPGWGCGSKLPHNITALLGVMDGAASDLRTGLPWQMVEIHEPVRLLFVIESTPEALLNIMERNPGIGTMCRNGWVHVSVLHPQTGEIQLFRDGVFQPYQPQVEQLPVAPSSQDWYRGWRDHLEFAEIGTDHGSN